MGALHELSHTAGIPLDGSPVSAPGASAAPDNGRGGRSLVEAIGGAMQAFTSRTFGSLAAPDYRMLWLGLMGTWMAMQLQQTARGYLAYQLTASPLALGLVTLSMGIPRMVLSPLGGVLADRMPKRDLVALTQVANAVIAFAAVALIQTGWINITWLIILGFIQGTAFALNMPVRQAYIPETVGTGPGMGDRLANAIALNNAGMNMMRIFGPSIAGVLIGLAFFGVKGVFALIALFYLAAAFTVSHIKVRGMPVSGKKRAVGKDLATGWREIAKNHKVAALMSLGFIPLAIGMPYENLMPVFAVSILKTGALGLGELLTTTGVGGLIGTLLIAYLAKYPRKTTLQLMFGVVFGASLISFALFARMHWLLLVYPFVFLAGLAGGAYMAINSTLIMTNIDPAVYGRVMGVYMVIQSIRPVSVLPVSALAEKFGTDVVVAGAGAVVMLFVLGVATLYPEYRQIR